MRDPRYLSGSAWKEYAAHGTLAPELPPGLLESGKLEPAIFSPATKAETVTTRTSRWRGWRDRRRGRDVRAGAHDPPRVWVGEKISRAQGIIIADTKFEFGRDASGRIILIDEVMTPDSSRFWAADVYKPGQPQPSFASSRCATISTPSAGRAAGTARRRRPTARQRGGRHQQALPRSLSAHHRRRAEDWRSQLMTLTVREMAGSEIDIIIEYFLRSTRNIWKFSVSIQRVFPLLKGCENASRTSGHSPIEQRAWSSSSGYWTTGPSAFRRPTGSLW